MPLFEARAIVPSWDGQNTMNKHPAHASPAAAPSHAPTNTTTTFQDFALDPAFKEALRIAGYVKPTSIQEQAIPPALLGRDVLGTAQTGTGKTAAFALPILQQLAQQVRAGTLRPMPRAPKALVLAPTRELAAQIGRSFQTYAGSSRMRCAVVFGGVGQGPQVRAVAHGVEILVATPGRLLDLMEQRHIDLRQVSFLVLDEADHMLDMGFIQPIRQILSAIPKHRQSMMFSATMPATIKHLADAILNNPVRVAVAAVAATADRVEQRLYKVSVADKPALLVHLLRQKEVKRALVFTKTKHGADRVVKRLDGVGIAANAIHGNKGQSQRTRTLEAFRSGIVPVLVATDIAARGIDVAGITHVINFDMPLEETTYVHRIGRTARADAEGVAISLCCSEERGLLRNIEKLIHATIPVHHGPAHLPSIPTAAPHRGPAGGGDRRSHASPHEPSRRPHAPERRPHATGAHRPSASGSDRRSHESTAHPAHGSAAPRRSTPSHPAPARSHAAPRGPVRKRRPR